MPAGLQITLQTVPSSPDTEVTLTGELDVTVAPELARALGRLRGTARGGLVLHLGEVEYLDCACAEVIAQAAAAWPGSGRVVIGEASPVVRRVLELTGLAGLAGLDALAAPATGGAGGAPVL